MTLRSAAPVFVVKDVLKSVEHYRDVLGFKVEFTYGQPTFYAGVERDNLLLHLQAASETKRDAGQSLVYVFVTDVDGLHKELASKGARVVKPPQDYDYGMRDFNVSDPDGNNLCFGMETKRRA